MTKSEMALVLAKAASFDARTIGESDVEAWYECVGELEFKVALEAVTSHYRDNTDRLMPAHLMPSRSAPETWEWR